MGGCLPSLSTGDVIALFAAGISIGALWYARSAARSSELSASASQRSAKTAEEALAFEKEKRMKEHAEGRARRIGELLSRVNRRMGEQGHFLWIFDEAPDLSPDERYELATQFYARRGKSRAHAVRVVDEWYANRAKQDGS